MFFCLRHCRYVRVYCWLFPCAAAICNVLLQYLVGIAPAQYTCGNVSSWTAYPGAINQSAAAVFGLALNFSSPLSIGAYKLAVKAVDAVGLSSVVCGAVGLDDTPPQFLSSPINDLNNVGVNAAYASKACVSFDVQDEESGVSVVTVTLMDSNGTTVVPATAISALSSWYCFDSALTGQLLVPGHSYSTLVYAANGCSGFSSTASTPTFQYDTTPPTMGAVRDGDPTLCGGYVDASVNSYGYFAANWDLPTDPTGLYSLVAQVSVATLVH